MPDFCVSADPPLGNAVCLALVPLCWADAKLDTAYFSEAGCCRWEARHHAYAW